jgi:hypothetical protein
MGKTMKLSVANKYRTFAVVSGKNVFPVDMLRYDQCFPYGSNDVYGLFESTAEETGIFSLILAQDSASPKGNWTPDRWRSFGWTLHESFAEAYDAIAYVESMRKETSK